MQMNEVTVVGNLTRDPEVKTISEGTNILNLSLAINRKYKVKDEMKQEVVFIECSLWGKEVIDLEQAIQKGSQVLVFGKLKQEIWDDKKTGEKKSKIKIQATKIIPIPNYGNSGTNEEGE